MSNQATSISKISFIKLSDSDPLRLFKEWKVEAASNSESSSKWIQNAFNLATVSPEGQPRNRFVVLKELDDGGFIFVTDKRGSKMDDIKVNPRVGATFVWNYHNGTTDVVKQVRIEGSIDTLNDEKCQQYFDEEVPYCRIRSFLCHQGEEIDWKRHNAMHDELVRKYVNGELDVQKPDHYVGLKIIPHRMEFYYAEENCIADRIVFTKDSGIWKYTRVAP